MWGSTFYKNDRVRTFFSTRSQSSPANHGWALRALYPPLRLHSLSASKDKSVSHSPKKTNKITCYSLHSSSSSSSWNHQHHNVSLFQQLTHPILKKPLKLMSCCTKSLAVDGKLGGNLRNWSGFRIWTNTRSWSASENGACTVMSSYLFFVIGDQKQEHIIIY